MTVVSAIAVLYFRDGILFRCCWTLLSQAPSAGK